MNPIKPPRRYPELADPQVRLRFTGVPTFFRLPYTEDLAGLDIGIIGVPYDGGVTNRAGARHGPREVRNQSSLLRTVNAVTGISPFAGRHVADLGDCWIEQPYALEGALAEIATFFHSVKAANVTTLAVGGDHSISLPILRAVAAKGPLGMVHIDAHCDTGNDYLGSRFHHGAPFRCAVEENLLDPKRVIQIGIRGTLNDPDMWGFCARAGCGCCRWRNFMTRAGVSLSRRPGASSARGPRTSRSTSIRSTPSTRRAPARRKRLGVPRSRRCACCAA